MSMCGHATVGAVWLLHQNGRLQRDRLTLQTRSGKVAVRITGYTDQGAAVEISQPMGRVEPLPQLSQHEILDALGINSAQLAPLPIQNASTSRVKTLVPLNSPAVLDALQPRFDKIEAVCERIGSTGLYPYATFDAGRQIFDARQFPRASGYPEDAATGIAASALSFGLLANGMVEASMRAITVRQGRAMKRPSQISVRFSVESGRVDGCWLGGPVCFETRIGASS
jgi:PhzF family phenazine biosynthesis protein